MKHTKSKIWQKRFKDTISQNNIVVRLQTFLFIFLNILLHVHVKLADAFLGLTVTVHKQIMANFILF